MSSQSAWGNAFGGLVAVYIVVILVLCLPGIKRALQAFARGEGLMTLRDERLAAAEDWNQVERSRESHSMLDHDGRSVPASQLTAATRGTKSEGQPGRPELRIVRMADPSSGFGA